MKIWQVKYKSGGGDSKYLYYKAEKEEDVNDKTQFYISYTDCRDEVNVTVVYDTIKVREMLVKKYKKQ
jgi:hypothetical protein